MANLIVGLIRLSDYLLIKLIYYICTEQQLFLIVKFYSFSFLSFNLHLNFILLSWNLNGFFFRVFLLEEPQNNPISFLNYSISYANPEIYQSRRGFQNLSECSESTFGFKSRFICRCIIKFKERRCQRKLSSLYLFLF